MKQVKPIHNAIDIYERLLAGGDKLISQFDTRLRIIEEADQVEEGLNDNSIETSQPKRRRIEQVVAIPFSRRACMLMIPNI
jgi:hypothetical protein